MRVAFSVASRAFSAVSEVTCARRLLDSAARDFWRVSSFLKEAIISSWAMEDFWSEMSYNHTER